MTEKALGKQAVAASVARSSRDLGRRRLLQGMVSGGGALAVVAVGGETLSSGTEAAADRSADSDMQPRFAATEHVRWYYARARW